MGLFVKGYDCFIIHGVYFQITLHFHHNHVKVKNRPCIVSVCISLILSEVSLLIIFLFVNWLDILFLIDFLVIFEN